jgi:hypothetical protein
LYCEKCVYSSGKNKKKARGKKKEETNKQTKIESEEVIRKDDEKK